MLYEVITWQLKNLAPWQAAKYNCRARRAGCSKIVVTNFHMEPNFAKNGHRTLMVLVALQYISCSYGAHVMAGDANAATQRLYSTTRKDQQGGVRPDPQNCALQVASRMFQDAFNKNLAIKDRIQVQVVLCINSYHLASQEMIV